MLKRFDSNLLQLLLPGFSSGVICAGLILVYTQSGFIFEIYAEDVLSLPELAYLVLLSLSQVLGYITPLVLLAVGLWLVHGLTANKELIIFQVIGLTPIRLVAPLIGGACLATFTSLVYNVFFLADATTSLRSATISLSSIAGKEVFQQGKFKRLGKESVIFVRNIESDSAANGVFFYESFKDDEGTGDMAILSKRMENINDRLELKMGHQVWNFPSGRYIISFDSAVPETTDIRNLSFKKGKNPFERTFSELLNEKDVKRRVELHRRLSEPFLSISMGLIVMLLILINPSSVRTLRMTTAGLATLGVGTIYLYVALKANIGIAHVWLYLYLVPSLPLIFLILWVVYHFGIEIKRRRSFHAS